MAKTKTKKKQIHMEITVGFIKNDFILANRNYA